MDSQTVLQPEIQLPEIFSCGSNSSGQLSLNHSNDTSRFQRILYHPLVTEHILAYLALQEFSFPNPIIEVLDLVSSSSHSLLLLQISSSSSSTSRSDSTRLTERFRKTILLGAGTNTSGQLGPKCALFSETVVEGRFKPLNLLSHVPRFRDDNGIWEVDKIASSWSTSFVLYRRCWKEVQISGSTGYVDTSGEFVGEREQEGKGEGYEYILIACGSNDFGELGIGGGGGGNIRTSTPSSTPTVIDLGMRRGEWVEYLRAGQRHVIVVISQGRGVGRRQRIVGWGASRKGELDGLTAVISSLDFAIHGISDNRGNNDGNGKGKGKGKSPARSPVLPPSSVVLPIPSYTLIVDLRVGASHSLILLSDGRVIAWGSDLKGQIGGVLGFSGKVRGIGASWGGSYLLAREFSGDDHMEEKDIRGNGIWSLGSNSHSQLLRNTSWDGHIGQVEVPLGVVPRRIAVGSEHVLVVTSGKDTFKDGLYVGGWNEHGNLGLGDQDDRKELVGIDLDNVVDGRYRIRGAWGGCAASWVWVDAM